MEGEIFWEHLKSQHSHKRLLFFPAFGWREVKAGNWWDLVSNHLRRFGESKVWHCLWGQPAFTQSRSSNAGGSKGFVHPIPTRGKLWCWRSRWPKDRSCVQTMTKRVFTKKESTFLQLVQLHRLQSYIHIQPTVCSSSLSNLKYSPQNGAIYLPFFSPPFLSLLRERVCQWQRDKFKTKDWVLSTFLMLVQGTRQRKASPIEAHHQLQVPLHLVHSCISNDCSITGKNKSCTFVSACVWQRTEDKWLK